MSSSSLPYAQIKVRNKNILTQQQMDENTEIKNIQIERTVCRTFLNFYGSFIDAWMLRITPFPSKSNTAMPKKRGIELAVNKLIFSCNQGYSSMFSNAQITMTHTKHKTNQDSKKYLRANSKNTLEAIDTQDKFLKSLSQQIGIKMKAAKAIYIDL